MKKIQVNCSNLHKFLICLGIWAGFTIVYSLIALIWGIRGFDSQALIIIAVSVLTLTPCAFKAFHLSATCLSLFWLLTLIGELYCIYDYKPIVTPKNVTPMLAFHGFVLGLILGIYAEINARLKKKLYSDTET